MAILYPRGTIVIASQLVDPQGENPKDRPVILVIDCLDEHDRAFGVAITSQIDKPIPEFCCYLPYQAQGNCRTGLTQESVANCKWLAEVAREDILRTIGHMPSDLFEAMLKYLVANKPPPETCKTIGLR